jgi:O-antigen ligase
VSLIWLAWLASGIAVAAVGIAQWIGGVFVQAGNVGRVTGPYFSPNHLALYLGRVWPLALTLALFGKLSAASVHPSSVRSEHDRVGWPHFSWHWVAWGGVVVLTAGLYLTYSRAAWLLAVPLALIVLGGSYRHRLRLWSVSLVVLGVLIAAAGVLLGRQVLSPLDELRLPVWQSTAEMITDHPWLGAGLDGFRFVYPRYMRPSAWTEPLLFHPHNMWLDAAVRLGLPGLFLFGGLIVACLVMVVRWRDWACHDIEEEPRQMALACAVAVGCLAGLAAGLAHGLVDSGYFLADLAWSLALVAGLASRADEGIESQSGRGLETGPSADLEASRVHSRPARDPGIEKMVQA